MERQFVEDPNGRDRGRLGLIQLQTGRARSFDTGTVQLHQDADVAIAGRRGELGGAFGGDVDLSAVPVIRTAPPSARASWTTPTGRWAIRSGPGTASRLQDSVPRRQ